MAHFVLQTVLAAMLSVPFITVSYEAPVLFPKIRSGTTGASEGESEHHPMRCLRSSTCLERLLPICSSRGVLEGADRGIPKEEPLLPARSPGAAIPETSLQERFQPIACGRVVEIVQQSLIYVVRTGADEADGTKSRGRSLSCSNCAQRSAHTNIGLGDQQCPLGYSTLYEASNTRLPLPG